MPPGLLPKRRSLSLAPQADGSPPLRLCVLFVDAQRDPQESDAQLLDFLEQCDVPVTVVATKIDKLNKNAIEPSLSLLRESLALPDDQPLPFSAQTGLGKKELWQRIQDECTA